jgi:hypothetical protein
MTWGRTPLRPAMDDTARDGWREPFGRLWHDLALRRAAPRADPGEEAALRSANQAVQDAARWLQLVCVPGRAANPGEFERSLSAGAAVLEGCAQVAQECGPPPRGGRLKMLR